MEERIQSIQFPPKYTDNKITGWLQADYWEPYQTSEPSLTPCARWEEHDQQISVGLSHPGFIVPNPGSFREVMRNRKSQVSLQNLNLKLTAASSFPVQTLPLLSCHYATDGCSQKQPPCLAALLLFKQTASPPSAPTDGWRTQMNETETQSLLAARWVLSCRTCRWTNFEGFKWKSPRSLFGRVCVFWVSVHTRFLGRFLYKVTESSTYLWHTVRPCDVVHLRSCGHGKQINWLS